MTDYYGTAALYTAYWLARGVVVSDDQSEIEAALLVASEYIDNKYRLQFPGEKTGLRAQVREWPRTGAYDWWRYSIATDEIPLEVKNATYEAASRQLASPGSLLVDVTMAEGLKSASVDGAVSVSFFGAVSPADMQVSIPVIDRILAPLLVVRGGSALSGDVLRV